MNTNEHATRRHLRITNRQFVWAEALGSRQPVRTDYGLVSTNVRSPLACRSLPGQVFGTSSARSRPFGFLRDTWTVTLTNGALVESWQKPTRSARHFHRSVLVWIEAWPGGGLFLKVLAIAALLAMLIWDVRMGPT